MFGNGVTASGSTGKNGSKTAGATVEGEVRRELSSASSEDSTVVHSTTCTPRGSIEDGTLVLGTGLWQWVITTEDYSVSAFTPHTVCRTGEDAYKAPKCVFWDCINHDCTKCKGDEEPEAE